MSNAQDIRETQEFDEEAANAAASGGDWSGMGADSRPAKNFGPSFKRLIGLLAPWKLKFAFATVLGVCWVLLTLWGPRLLGDATNLIFEGVFSSQMPAGVTKEQMVAQLEAAGETNFAEMVGAMDLVPGAGIDFEALSRTLLMVVAIYLVATLLDYWVGYMLNGIVIKAMHGLRRSVEEKIHSLPLSYFDRTKRGEMLSRVTNDVDNLTNALQQSLIYVINSVLMVLGLLIVMFSISWTLALIALVTLPITGVIIAIIGPKSQKAFQGQWKSTGKLNARVEESFSGHALVRVFGREQESREKFRDENGELFEASFKAQFLSGLMMPLMQFAGTISTVGIAVVGGLQIASGTLRLGDVQAFLQYSQQFSGQMGQLGQMAPVIQSATASAERVFELLDADDETPDDPNAPELEPGPGRIEFDHVAFSYERDHESPDWRPLIQDLSFTVNPGQTVAIVGPTGAGKTTLVNLVMRFYDVDSGRILLDGQTTGDLRRHDVRARTGMVLQDPWLFQGTILENIRYGNNDATDEQLKEAARATYVDRFVQSLPDGYDTVLDEDASNVSAGEKQLITIARAFVANPAVLILDEATSSVDTRTELLLQHAMNALREGRTSFVIAHRLSTIRDADLILVMEQGSIVEQGDHDSLLAQQGAYWRLYQSQFSGAGSDHDADLGDGSAEHAAAATGAIPVAGEGSGSGSGE
jgi:ATP-binding cassette subfamily B protein